MLQRFNAHFTLERAPEPHACDRPLLQLLHSEALVLAALQQLPTAERQALAQNGPRARALLCALVDRDLAVAVPMLRQMLVTVSGHAAVPPPYKLFERAWQQGCPQLAYNLLGLGRRTPQEYMDRFPKEWKMWARMVDDGLMQPVCYLRRFAADVDQLALWLQRGQLSQQLCRQLFAADSNIIATLEAMELLHAPGSQALVLHRRRTPGRTAWQPEPLPPYSAPPKPCLPGGHA